VRIRIHYSWIAVFALVTLIVTTQFSEIYPLSERILFGLSVSVLFLAAAILREYILNLAAFYGKSTSRTLTLFAFGGVFQENRDIIDSTQRPLLYAARFLSNLVITGVFYGLYATFTNANSLIMAGIAQWLTFIFFLVLLLHFVPAFPLDAGKILRMILWRSSGDYNKATHTASLIGWATGLFLMFFSVLIFIITQQWLISVVTLFIGWLLYAAAGNTRRKVKTLVQLQCIKAKDIISKDYPVMRQKVNIGELLREHILVKGWPYVLVVEDTKLKGILTLNQINAVPHTRWHKTTIGDIMTPVDKIKIFSPEESAAMILEEMDLRHVDYLPVMEGEKIAGVANRATLSNLVKIRAGLGF
jgi:predicted transcriptional regulator/Zn-dependent protease